MTADWRDDAGRENMMKWCFFLSAAPLEQGSKFCHGLLQLWWWCCCELGHEDGWGLWVQEPPVACCTFNHGESAEFKDLVFSSIPVFPNGTPGPSCWLLCWFALTLSLHVFHSELWTNADNWDTAGMTAAPSYVNAGIFSMASSSCTAAISNFLLTYQTGLNPVWRCEERFWGSLRSYGWGPLHNKCLESGPSDLELLM